MNRKLTAVFSALEALLVVGIGLGITLVPLTLMWGLQYGLQVDWVVFWRASVDIWLMGHGTELWVTLDETLAAQLGFAGAAAPFVLSFSPLGFGLLTLLLAQRAGRRIAETPHVVVGLIVATTVFAVLSLVGTFTATHILAATSLVPGTLFPTLVFAAGLGLGAGLARFRLKSERSSDALDRLYRRLTDWPATVKAVLVSAAAGGLAAVTAVLAVASILLAVLIAVNYGAIIALYESAHAGVLGGAALTIAQLGFVPNLVVWSASWLLGPGFAVGAGSAVSPLGTTLGPIPAIPVFGALPTGDFAWGFLGLLVPVIAAFLIGVVLRGRLVAGLRQPPTFTLVLTTGALTGLVAGIVFALLAWWSGGSGGPGRLGELGPSPVWVGLCALLEVGIAVTLGLVAAGIRDTDGARAEQ